jgi:hypothetical protein
MRDEKLLGKSFKKRLFKPDTWFAWRAFLCGVFNLPFEDDDAFELFRKCTGRALAPVRAFREIFLIAGRRSGKSFLCALIACYLAAFRNYGEYLAGGETPVVAVIAQDRESAQVILKYVKAFFKESVVLRSMLVGDLREKILLSNNVEIQILTGDYKSIRGRTLIGAVVDELAFLNSDGSANSDSELLAAVRPSLISIPNSLLIGLSSPFSRQGVLWQEFKNNFGKDDSTTLIWKATSLEMNPSLDKERIDAAFAKDPVAARTEFDAEFRQDSDGFLTQEILDAVMITGRTSLPRLQGVSYTPFCDMSGGRSDSATLCIGHLENKKAVVDLLVERPAPHVPQEVTADFSRLLKHYGCSEVTADKYSAEWAASEFASNGITLRPSEKTRSQLYLEFLPACVSRQVELPDHPKMISQFLGLSRKAGRAQDQVDHLPGQHDDISNSVAGCLVQVLSGSGEFGWLDYVKGIVSGRRQNPATQNTTVAETKAGQEKAIAQEAKRLGIDPATLNPERAPVTNPQVTGPCRFCGNASTCWLGEAKHCNQCGKDDYPNGREEIVYMGRNGPISRKPN